MTQNTAILANLATFQAAIDVAPSDNALNDLLASVTGQDQSDADFDLGSDHIVSLADGIVIAWGAEGADGRDLVAYFSSDRAESLGFVTKRREEIL